MIGAVFNAAVVAASPCTRTGNFEIDTPFISDAAPTFSIDNFKVNQRDVGTISSPTARCRDRRQLDRRRFACRLFDHRGNLFPAAERDHFDFAGLKLNVWPREQCVQT